MPLSLRYASALEVWFSSGGNKLSKSPLIPPKCVTKSDTSPIRALKSPHNKTSALSGIFLDITIEYIKSIVFYIGRILWYYINITNVYICFKPKKDLLMIHHATISSVWHHISIPPRIVCLTNTHNSPEFLLQFWWLYCRGWLWYSNPSNIKSLWSEAQVSLINIKSFCFSIEPNMSSLSLSWDSPWIFQNNMLADWRLIDELCRGLECWILEFIWHFCLKFLIRPGQSYQYFVNWGLWARFRNINHTEIYSLRITCFKF